MAAIIPVIGLALTAGSAIFQTISQVGQQRRQAQAQEQEAKLAELQGQEDKRKLLRQRDKLTGRQKSQFASSGVQLGGSPLAVILEDVKEGTIDALSAERRGQRVAQVKRFSASQTRGRIPGIVAGGIGSLGQSLLTFKSRGKRTVRG